MYPCFLRISSCLSQGKYDKQYEQSEEFRQELKVKVRELLTEQEWRRRKMQMRVCSNHPPPTFSNFNVPLKMPVTKSFGDYLHL